MESITLGAKSGSTHGILRMTSSKWIYKLKVDHDFRAAPRAKSKVYPAGTVIVIMDRGMASHPAIVRRFPPEKVDELIKVLKSAPQESQFHLS